LTTLSSSSTSRDETTFSFVRDETITYLMQMKFVGSTVTPTHVLNPRDVGFAN
jgi:hypothetical protein